MGGWLDRFVGRERLTDLISYVDGVWREYGAPEEVHGGGKKFEKFRKEALLHGMTLVESPVRHMGTERSYDILTRMRAELETKVEVLTRSRVERILAEKPAGESELRATGVVLEDGTRLTSDAVIAAPGRDGAAWLMEECKRLHIAMRTNPVDIGVRVEVSAAVMEPLTTALYESKLIYYTPRFDDPVRTFCMNPYGAVSLENYGDVVTVNGHSYADFKTDRTNFALLVSTDFTEPFDDPIAYGKSIARLANVLGEDIIVQRLGDLHQGHRSTMDRIRRGTVQPTLRGATAGDLAFVLPYRHLTDILEMLAAMDKIAPGVNGRDTLLYGVEVKFYSARPELDDGLQTPVKNLYAVGDGAGITRGLIQASAAGVIAARSILGIGDEAAAGEAATVARPAIPLQRPPADDKGPAGPSAAPEEGPAVLALGRALGQQLLDRRAGGPLHAAQDALGLLLALLDALEGFGVSGVAREARGKPRVQPHHLRALDELVREVHDLRLVGLVRDAVAEAGVEDARRPPRAGSRGRRAGRRPAAAWCGWSRAMSWSSAPAATSGATRCSPRRSRAVVSDAATPATTSEWAMRSRGTGWPASSPRQAEASGSVSRGASSRSRARSSCVSASSSTPGSSTGTTRVAARVPVQQFSQAAGRIRAADLVAQPSRDQRGMAGDAAVDGHGHGSPPSVREPAACASRASRPTVSGRTSGTSAGRTKNRVTSSSRPRTPTRREEYIPASGSALVSTSAPSAEATASTSSRRCPTTTVTSAIPACLNARMAQASSGLPSA